MEENWGSHNVAALQRCFDPKTLQRCDEIHNSATSQRCSAVLITTLQSCNHFTALQLCSVVLTHTALPPCNAAALAIQLHNAALLSCAIGPTTKGEKS